MKLLWMSADGATTDLEHRVDLKVAMEMTSCADLQFWLKLSWMVFDYFVFC